MIASSQLPAKPVQCGADVRTAESAARARSPVSSVLTPSPLTVEAAEPAPKDLRCEYGSRPDSKAESVGDSKSEALFPEGCAREGLAELFSKEATCLIEQELGLPKVDSRLLARQIAECFDNESFGASAKESCHGVVDLASLPFHAYPRAGRMMEVVAFSDLIKNFSDRLGVGFVVRWVDVDDRQIYFPTRWPVNGKREQFRASAAERADMAIRIREALDIEPDEGEGITAALLSGFGSVTTPEAFKERLNFIDLEPLRDYVFKSYEDQAYASAMYLEMESRLASLIRDEDGPWSPRFVKVRLVIPVAGRASEGDNELN